MPTTPWTNHLRWGSVILVGLAVVAAVSLGREWAQNREMRKEIARMEAENTRLEGERLASLALLQELSSEYWLEGQARKQGLVRPGETMVIIPSAAPSATIPVTVTSDRTSNPAAWWNYFFAQKL